MSDSTDTPKVQHGLDWLRQATPEQTATALHDGHLDNLLRGEATDAYEPEQVDQINRDQLSSMTADQIVEAHQAGRLDDVLGGAGQPTRWYE